MNDLPINCGLEPEMLAKVCQDNENIPFYRYLHIQTGKVGKGYTNLVMTAAHEFTNPTNTFHGGAAATLADIAMGMAIRTTGMRAVSVELSISFFLPVKEGGTVSAEARLIYQGRNLIMGECELWDGDGVLVAKARGIYQVKSRLVSSEEGLDWVSC